MTDPYAIQRQQAVERAKKAQNAINAAKLKAKRFEIIESNITKLKTGNSK